MSNTTPGRVPKALSDTWMAQQRKIVHAKRLRRSKRLKSPKKPQGYEMDKEKKRLYHDGPELADNRTRPRKRCDGILRYPRLVYARD